MHSILLLPGDGIGPEVVTETRRVVGWFTQNRNFGCTFEEDLVGGISYEKHGVPATDAMIAKAKAADAVLFGAVGGPKWDPLPFDKKPEQGLLQTAQDARAVRQPSPCALLRRTEGCVDTEARISSPASTSSSCAS